MKEDLRAKVVAKDAAIEKLTKAIAGTKHIFSQLLGQMRFTHAGRTEKHKRSDRAVRVFQAYTAAQDGFCKFLYRSILSHNFCLQIFFHTCKLKTFRSPG